MNAAKIRLSAKEMELITNADWILTKNAILQKTNQLLGQLQQLQQQHLQSIADKLPVIVLQSSPKISKGDNYRGLPYLVLDYPKYFDRSAVFAIRTMFWWGNFFSVTLHLAGHFKTSMESKIIAALPALKENGFYRGVNTDQWEHHFEEDNYQPLTGLDETDLKKEIRSGSFIKLAKKIPLEKWDEAENMLFTCFRQLTGVVES